MVLREGGSEVLREGGSEVRTEALNGQLMLAWSER